MFLSSRARWKEGTDCELEWRWREATPFGGLCALSGGSSGEDRVDIVLRCVTQRGQGSGVEVKGMTAQQGRWKSVRVWREGGG